MEMLPSEIEKTLKFIKDEQIPLISLVGVGEPTFRSDWMSVCDQLTSSQNIKINLITNFGRKLNQVELKYLLHFNFVGISLESSNAELQKEIRRSVDLATIITNIVALRTCARISGVKPPALLVNCTVTQRNIFGLVELAALCAELGVNQLNISSLFESETTRELGNESIEHLTKEQLDAASEDISRMQKLLNETSTRLAIQPRLSQFLKGKKEANWRADGSTRICLQPWGSYTFGADGRVFPCCVVQDSFIPFIHIDEGSNSVVNGEKIRQFRKQLLEGDLSEICQKCSNAPLGNKDELAKAIAIRAFNDGLAVPL